MDQYFVEGAHEPIVTKEEFESAQAAMKARGEKYARHHDNRVRYEYSGKLVCSHCGRSYCRRVAKGIHYWMCPTSNFEGVSACPSKQIPERCLKEAVPSMDGVKSIRVLDGNALVVEFEDGKTEEKSWKDPSRRDSWTPEMRERARQRAIRQRREQRERKCQK